MECEKQPITRVRYVVEYLLLRSLFIFCGFLSLDRASAFGGFLGSTIGPRLPITRRALQNMKNAFPHWSDAQVIETTKEMWEHLGRIMGEYPHLKEFKFFDGSSRIEVIGSEYIDQLRDDGIAGIFFSAHLGNWELLSLAASQRSLPLVQIYRAANNPYIDTLIQRYRSLNGSEHYPKGMRGSKALLEAVKKGQHLGLLVDQKYNEGIPVPFFGRKVMTTTTPADLAYKYNIPLVPVRIERTQGAHFKLTIFPPLSLDTEGTTRNNAHSITYKINALFESWIRENPAQWYWLHRRWPNNG